MPTDFQISRQPSIRCVTGEPYLTHTSDPAAFFARLRVAERLVINSGQKNSLAENSRSVMRHSLQETLTAFARKTSHA